MRRILLIGRTTIAKIVIDIAKLCLNNYEFSFKGFIDDSQALHGTLFCGLPVLGAFNEIDSIAADYDINTAVICIGHNHMDVRARYFEACQDKGFIMERFVHPSASIARGASIGAGFVAGANTVVNPDAVVGENVLLWSGSVIEHDCRIGAHSYVSPGVTLAGGVRLGEFSFIGSGATVLPEVNIGSRAIVGAGSVVTRDVPEATLSYGVPARVVRKL